MLVNPLPEYWLQHLMNCLHMMSHCAHNCLYIVISLVADAWDLSCFQAVASPSVCCNGHCDVRHPCGLHTFENGFCENPADSCRLQGSLLVPLLLKIFLGHVVGLYNKQ